MLGYSYILSVDFRKIRQYCADSQYQALSPPPLPSSKGPGDEARANHNVEDRYKLFGGKTDTKGNVRGSDV